MRRCSATTKKGLPCRGIPAKDDTLCTMHDPTRKEARSRTASIAARSRHTRLGKELQAIKKLSNELIEKTVSNDLTFSAKYLTQVIHLLQLYMRACELQIRLGEETLGITKSTREVDNIREKLIERVDAIEGEEHERQNELEEIQRVAEQFGVPLDLEGLA